ncbi:MAG: magnesium/cobalt transporter CorA [Candidatus Thorarchaeota archaeon]|jgi:magnesium transporter
MPDGTSKVGLPPGTPVHTGIERTEKVTIEIVEYNEEEMSEYEADSMQDCDPPHESVNVKWVHVNGVHDLEILQYLGDTYNIHPLILEDIPSVGQRPKVEVMQNKVYLVLRSFDIVGEDRHAVSEQVSIILGTNVILSFQESSQNLFEAITNRLRRPTGRIRKDGPDYLAYALVDIVVDNYFKVLEEVGELIEQLEDKLIEGASADVLGRIYKLKRTILALRRYIWPLREVIFALNRDDTELVAETTKVYLRDLYDHVIRVTDLAETYREGITGMLDIYLSSMSNKMNEVMKVLTVISTIFIPLTLMASIYGMNWPWMSELEFIYGYPVFLIAMLIITSVLMFYFRRRGWI